MSMMDVFRKWYERYLFEEESILLLVLLGIGLLLLVTIGNILAPVLAALVLAFLMQGMADRLRGFGMPSWLAMWLSYLVFVSAFFGAIFVLLPLFWRQVISLAREMPRMFEQGKTWIEVLPAEYPQLVSDTQVREALAAIQRELTLLAQTVVTFSLSTIPSLVALLVYIVLVPILVFFLLKDREQIMNWLGGFLPSRRPLLRRIWSEMDDQVANYARGKVLEILIVGVVTYVVFLGLGLNYAALLAILVGVSVIIPYIGAAVVTLPVAAIGLFQWGFSADFYWLMLAYFVIQALDGNVLVPLLFSEAVNLHPVAIILAVLFFGGIWGMWGVFFAIPLATLIKAIINAWPKRELVASNSDPLSE